MDVLGLLVGEDVQLDHLLQAEEVGLHHVGVESLVALILDGPVEFLLQPFLNIVKLLISDIINILNALENIPLPLLTNTSNFHFLHLKRILILIFPLRFTTQRLMKLLTGINIIK